jgi:hypothetical protein
MEHLKAISSVYIHVVRIPDMLLNQQLTYERHYTIMALHCMRYHVLRKSLMNRVVS